MFAITKWSHFQKDFLVRVKRTLNVCAWCSLLPHFGLHEHERQLTNTRSYHDIYEFIYFIMQNSYVASRRLFSFPNRMKKIMNGLWANNKSYSYTTCVCVSVYAEETTFCFVICEAIRMATDIRLSCSVKLKHLMLICEFISTAAVLELKLSATENR